MFDFLKRTKKAEAARAAKSLSPSSLKQSLLALEPRLMFDAAAAATAAEVKSEQVAQEQAEAAVSTEASHETTGAETGESQDVLNALASYLPTESRTEVVFVDPTVPNYHELLAGMDPNTEVIMLDAGKDGVQQIADSLAGRTGVDAIHLISHGNAGELQLGTSHLTQESMTGQYANELVTIRQSLSEQADILIYGCDFAEGDSGQAAVNCLAALTGADVEASSDLTGNAAFGGDWDLEVKTGSIETRIAIDVRVQADWMGLLAAPALDATKSPALSAVAEDAGAPSGTVGTLVSSLVDFANPAGQVDNVTDGDAGAQLGIAITGANTSNGTWWYTTNNGSTWNALGAVGEGSARLLAADASTRVYFRANTDYNGTMSDALTFRAWDQTSGTAGSTADLTGVANTVKDQFSSASYSNNNGTANWSGNWVETDSGGGGASGGRIEIESGQLDIRADAVNDGIYREANLSNATSATLSFSYNNALGSGDTIAVQVSSDGGAHYTTLTGGNFSNALHTGSGTVSFDITSAISANTRVRFLVTAENDNNHLYVDNVQISYSSSGTGGNTAFSGSTDTAALTVTSVNDAPTDLALSANSVAEQTTNGTVVGTVSGTDPDAGDTKTYSLTDTAGGRFAINASTGVITVADGSLLNYESAPSHSVTVRVTDSGGLTYAEAFTINLTNVNETPTDLALSANSVAEQTTNGTVVGTVSGTDPDAGDTKAYSLTDTAGGRFAINASTGVITVADGSLLNYESAPSHSVTVRVTDSGGLTYAEAFTINLTNVNEAPPRQSLPGSLVSVAPTSGPGNSGPLSLSTGVANEITGDGTRPPEDLRRSIEIRTETSLAVEALSPERAPARSVPIESLDGSLENAEAEELLERSSSWSDESGKAQAQPGPSSMRSVDGRQIDVKESEQKPDQVDAAATTEVALAVGMAGVVLQGGLQPKEKVTALGSRLRGNAPLPPGSHGNEQDRSKSDGSESGKPRPS